MRWPPSASPCSGRGTASRPPRWRTRARYLTRHPDAAGWVDFGDFAFWRLDVEEVYMVGGFGVMGWVTPDVYSTAAT
jgi:hypothetical protein